MPRREGFSGSASSAGWREVEKQQRAKKLKTPRVNMLVRRVIDKETGELLWGLVPMHDTDKRALRERRLKPDDLVAVEIKPPRDVVQWRKAHALGQYLVAHVDGFEMLTAHQAIKRVQFEGDIECDHEEFDLGTLGKVMRKVARSLSFESMAGDVFTGVWVKLCDYIGRSYLGGITDPNAIEEMIQMMPPVQFD